MVHLEPTPTGNHQANGAAEAMVHVLRTKANLLVQQIAHTRGRKLLVQQIEEATGCTKPIFGIVFTQFILGQLCTAAGCTITLL